MILLLAAVAAFAAAADLVLFIVWCRLPGCRDRRIAARNAAVRMMTLGRWS